MKESTQRNCTNKMHKSREMHFIRTGVHTWFALVTLAASDFSPGVPSSYLACLLRTWLHMQTRDPAWHQPLHRSNRGNLAPTFSSPCYPFERAAPFRKTNPVSMIRECRAEGAGAHRAQAANRFDAVFQPSSNDVGCALLFQEGSSRSCSLDFL